MKVGEILDRLTAAPEITRQPAPRVITVRMPADLHHLLIGLAHEKRTSLNKLCVAALLAACQEFEEGAR